MVADRVSRIVSGCLRIDAYVYLPGLGLVKKTNFDPLATVFPKKLVIIWAKISLHG